MAAEEILFVYNVDLTLFALVSDFVHRLTAPDTYPCRLGDLTYDRFTMKRDWKRFVDSLSVGVRFEPRDRFRTEHPDRTDVPLPAVFRVRSDGRVATLISASRINHARSLGDLKALVRAAVASLGS